MKVSRLSVELIAVLGAGTEMIEWELGGGKRGAPSTLASSNADGGQYS